MKHCAFVTVTVLAGAELSERFGLFGK
jgi:hypothetical protein